ncbi:MAG: galactose oxidase [Bacteroidetes bacterium]|nr:galactose oxidase [Bacteroidota bacterium]
MKKIDGFNFIRNKVFSLSFIILLGIAVTVTMINVSCGEDDPVVSLVGNWIELSSFEGIPRSDAVGFAIGNKGYVGTGYDGEKRSNCVDFWEYDPDRNTWNQKADFLGGERNGAVGFGTDTKGYVGTGYDGKDSKNDFWEYDPVLNTWTQKADFGGSARYGAVGITINNKCYIGTGYNGFYLKDFWEYDPATDVWTKKASVGGSKRAHATGFAINGKGYICTGVDNGAYDDDFWEYDPAADIWVEKRSISDATDESFDDEYTTLKGINKVAFAMNGKGYLATGGEGTATTIVWEYDPTTDLWEEKTAFEGTGRVDAVAFVIGSRGYIATGRSSSYYFDDIWAFDPGSEYNEDD